MGKRAKHNKRILQGNRRKNTKQKENRDLRTSCSKVHIISGDTEQERKADYSARHYKPKENNKNLYDYIKPTTIYKRKYYKVFDNQ